MRTTKLKETELELEEVENPGNMSAMYVQVHPDENKYCRTHLSYKSWCPNCVQEKRTNNGHKQDGKQE